MPVKLCQSCQSLIVLIRTLVFKEICAFRMSKRYSEASPLMAVDTAGELTIFSLWSAWSALYRMVWCIDDLKWLWFEWKFLDRPAKYRWTRSFSAFTGFIWHTVKIMRRKCKISTIYQVTKEVRAAFQLCSTKLTRYYIYTVLWHSSLTYYTVGHNYGTP